MEDRKPAYYAVIPAPVRHDGRLQANAKLLYGEISSLTEQEGFCTATNGYLAGLYEFTEVTVSRLIKSLSDCGYVQIEMVKDPSNGQVTQRRIWLKCALVEDTPLTKLLTPLNKNDKWTPIKENIYIPPKAPQGGQRMRRTKTVPDWKPERFEKFWAYYRDNARGENRQGAVRAWDRLKPDDELIATMGRALARQLQSESWRAGIGIPHASTWLNNRRWEDVPKLGTKPQAAQSVPGCTVEERGEVPEW